MKLRPKGLNLEGMTLLLARLKASKLTGSIRLDLTGFDSRLTSDILPEIAELLKENENLVELDFHDRKVNDEGVSVLSNGLKRNRGLKVLNLFMNKIQPEGASSLSEGLRNHPSIRTLNLGHNNLTALGARFVADVLDNTQLQVIFLHNNGIGDKGAQYISRALENHPTLTELVLSDNHITHEGAHHLSRALKVNRKLMFFRLNWNAIGDRGTRFIADALKLNRSLTILNLSKNNIGAKGYLDLYQALEVNQDLVELKLDDNKSHVTLGMRKILDRNLKRRQKEFSDTLNSDKKSSWNRSRIMFVGQGGAGKSATVRSLLGKAFIPEWNSTIGAVISESMGWQESTNQIDYSSQFAARIMIQDKLPNSVIPVSNHKIDTPRTSETGENDTTYIKLSSSTGKLNIMPESFETAEVRKPSARKNQNLFTQTIKQLSATEKSGKGPGESRKDIVREFKENFLVKARDDGDTLTFSLWDFGGQYVFYSMHHIFLTRSGIYILVFDMRQFTKEALEETCRYLSFWVNSIRLHAPTAPLLCVGTHTDDIVFSEEVGKVDKILRNIFKDDFPQVVPNLDENLMFYPIDNKSNNGIRLLRANVETEARKNKTIRQQVSIKWFLLLDTILSKRFDVPYLTLSTVKGMATDIGMTASNEQEESLSLFHERGLLIHLTSTEVLKSIIIIKPQWLISSLSKVIRDSDLHSYSSEEIEKCGLENDLEMAFEKGIASRDFLEYVWAENDQIEFLIDLMKRTMLLSEWNLENEKAYLIPSLLKNVFRGVVASGLHFVFDFSGGFLPNGVFQRLVCLCVAYKESADRRKLESERCEPPILYSNFCSIEFENGFVIHLREDVPLCQIVVVVENEMYAAQSVSLISSMLLKINYDVMGTGLKWKKLVEDGSRNSLGRLVHYEQARQEKLKPWFETSNFDPQIETEAVDICSFLDAL